MYLTHRIGSPLVSFMDVDCLSVTCGRSVVFLRYSGFLHQYNWPSWYHWNIAVSWVEHHKNHPWTWLCSDCSYLQTRSNMLWFLFIHQESLKIPKAVIRGQTLIYETLSNTNASKNREELTCSGMVYKRISVPLVAPVVLPNERYYYNNR